MDDMNVHKTTLDSNFIYFQDSHQSCSLEFMLYHLLNQSKTFMYDRQTVDREVIPMSQPAHAGDTIEPFHHLTPASSTVC